MSRIVLLVFRLFPLGDKCTLILDRTNWKWGKTPINILMLSIAYRGIGIPLFWVVLDLEGNSCAEDRIDLLKRVIERLGVGRIEVLLADREFIGTKWFHFLIEQKIPFIIRVKQNSMVEIGENSKLPIGRLRKWLSRKKIVNHSINLWGLSLYVSIEKRKGTKEQMIVVSNFKFEDPLGMYTERDSKIGKCQGGALFLSQAKPALKQLNLNKLSDASGSQKKWLPDAGRTNF